MRKSQLLVKQQMNLWIRSHWWTLNWEVIQWKRLIFKKKPCVCIIKYISKTLHFSSVLPFSSSYETACEFECLPRTVQRTRTETKVLKSWQLKTLICWSCLYTTIELVCNLRLFIYLFNEKFIHFLKKDNVK